MKFSMIIINLELRISNHVWRYTCIYVRNEVDMRYYNIIRNYNYHATNLHTFVQQKCELIGVNYYTQLNTYLSYNQCPTEM